MSDFETNVPDESEQLDQLQAADSLVDRGVADVLDEGYVTPENWSVAQGFGNTPAEMRQGETIEQRVRQEEPEKVKDDSWNPEGEPREVGSREGRASLWTPRWLRRCGHRGPEHRHSVVSTRGAASAEEAAMHVIEPIDDEEED